MAEAAKPESATVFKSVLHPRPSLLVFADDWGRHPSSCQYIVQHLLDGYEVYWVNTIGTRRPGLNLLTLRRGLGKLRQWTRPALDPAALPPHLHVLNPPMWLWFRSRFDRFLNRRLLARALLPVVKTLSTPCFAVTTIPIVADLIDVLPVQRWIYYCVDEYGQWPGLDRLALERMETRLIQTVDKLVAVSATLRDKIVQRGRPVSLVTHGVDLEFWAGGTDVKAVADAPGAQRVVSELENIQRPLVLFWGVADPRMEISFVTRLAADLRRGTIVLVGPQCDCDPALKRTGQVVSLGVVPYEMLPSLAREAAVLIMPYADIPVTRAMQPLKLKEYLATGKPAVVRDLPATREWRDCLDLAATPEAFSNAVRLRLTTGLPDDQRRARGRLKAESWAAKARLFERFALGSEPPRPRTQAYAQSLAV
jgi:glycosyltransferase involved in cell wall biosynthesis